ncbi:MAG: hypothetical protein Fur0022_22720 [Anaerolineales bacterium]
MWTPFNFFIGSWQGTGKGQSGESQVERTYQFVLNGKFLQVISKSAYPPQDKNPKGEVHEEWGFISLDKGRKAFVFRQFHIEGFVNQYVMDAAETESQSLSEGHQLTFVTEAIENIPAGWRGKETYQVLGPDEFREIFELAAPGKDFEVYSENHLKRT